MTRIRVAYETTALATAFAGACEWAETITVCTSRIEHGHAGFEALHQHRAKVVYAIVGGVTPAARAKLIHDWAANGLWRVRDADESAAGLDLTWFEVDGDVRAFVLSGPMTPSTFEERPGTNMILSGRADEEAICAVRGLLEVGRRLGRLPFPGEVDGPPARRPHNTSPGRVPEPEPANEPVEETPEAVVVPSTPSAPSSSQGGSSAAFEDLDLEDQAYAVWEALVGAGALPRDEAIREAAITLRNDGVLGYERLRRDGKLYRGLDMALRHAQQLELIDKPERGEVRAVVRDLDDLSREEWRSCLVMVLEEGDLHREDAMREALTFARDIYGVQAKRIVKGGRAEAALKSAINSAIRRGEIEKVGSRRLRLPGEDDPS